MINNSHLMSMSTQSPNHNHINKQLTLSFSKIKHLFYEKHLPHRPRLKLRQVYRRGIYMHKIIENKYMQLNNKIKREVNVSKVVEGVLIKGIIDLMSPTIIYEIKPLTFYYNERELVRLQVALYSLLFPNHKVIYILYNDDGSYKECEENDNLALYKNILLNIIREYRDFHHIKK